MIAMDCGPGGCDGGGVQDVRVWIPRPASSGAVLYCCVYACR